jgi:mannose-6-phosphate isomerase-like protein (cupin superfamily)
MNGYKTDIEKDALENNDFRRVLYTGRYLQLVLMSLEPGKDTGGETHQKNDQFFRFESGLGKCIIDGNEYLVQGGDIIIVPAGSWHNIINIGTAELKLYTIYGPPNQREGCIRATRDEALRSSEIFDGYTTE